MYDPTVSRAAVFALVLAGCYSPSPGAGAPCTTDTQCPGTQRCVANTCGGSPHDGSPDDSDAENLIDAPPDTPIGAWSTPVPVAGVNTNDDESDPTFSPDRLTMFFTSNRDGDDDIWMGTRGSTAEPFVVSRLDTVSTTPNEEHSPEISPDGRTLYLSSTRGGNFDYWRAKLVDGVWQTPTKVLELSSASTEEDIAIAADGLEAIIERSSNKLYRATRLDPGAPWGMPLELAGSFGSGPAGIALDAAGNLYLHATGNDRDLYFAKRNGNTFDPPVEILELTSNAREAAPFVSADGRYLMFECARDICESSR